MNIIIVRATLHSYWDPFLGGGRGGGGAIWGNIQFEGGSIGLQPLVKLLIAVAG